MDLLDELTAPKIATIKEKKNKKRGFIESPILYKSKGNIEYTFLLDTFPEDYKLKQICNYIESRGLKNNYQVLYPLKIKAKKKDFTEGDTIVKFIKNNMFNLHEFIPEWSKVMTFGRMLYVMTETNQINIEGNYDLINFNTNIFIPDYKCQIYPTETYDRSLFSSSFENYFTKVQFEIMQETELEPREIEPKTVVFIDDTSKFFRENLGEMLLAVDIETDGLDWITDKIGSIQFAFDSKTGYFLNWDDINIRDLDEFLMGKKIIGHNFSFDGKFIAHNGVSLSSLNIFADTMTMSHCINEMRRSNLKGLQAYYTDYYGYDRELSEFKEKYPDISYIDMPFDLRLKYGGYDPAVTFEIYEKMLEEIRSMDKEYPLDNGNSLEKYFRQEVMPTKNTHLESELVGININVEELFRNSIYFHKKIQALKNEIRRAFHITDKSINVSSGKQLSDIFKNLGWKDQGLNKDGSYTMDGEALNKFVKEGYKDVQLIIDLHTLETLMNAFVGYPKFKTNNDVDLWDLIDSDSGDTQKFDDFIFPERLNMGDIELGRGTGYWKFLKKTGRGEYKIFPVFGSFMAKSHRNRPKAPNTAQIPSHGQYAKRIRRQISVPKDYVLSDSDQSGLQMRNVSFLLEENSPLRDVFLKYGGDAHSITGCKILMNNKISLEEFMAKKKSDPYVAEMRQKSKAFNFSLLFGGQANMLKTVVIQPNWTEQECFDYISSNRISLVDNDAFLTVATFVRKRFYEEYYGLHNWLEKTKKKAKRDGFVRSPYGTFRRTPYLLVTPDRSDQLDRKRFSNYESICLNSPIQSLESVVMNRTLNNTSNYIKKNNLKSKFIIAVHDAFSYYVHKDEVSKICTSVKHFAEIMYPEFRGIPLEMEGNIADYWGTYRKTEIKDGKEVDAFEVWDNGHDWGKYIDESLIPELVDLYS